MFGGIVRDDDVFGDVVVRRQNVYAGLSVLRVAGVEGVNPFDVTLKSTVLSSEVDADPAQDNAQYRTGLTLRFRVKDEEKFGKVQSQGLALTPAFIHLLFSFRNDVAIEGPNEFDNVKIGTRVNMESFVEGRVLGPTFSASVGYDFQRFYKLDRDLHLFGLRIGMGF